MGSMHEYFTKGKNFKNEKILIIIISIVIAFLISKIINWISNKYSINLWWLEIPSIIGVYNIFENWIDKNCWSKFYKVPSFDGVWEGNIKSSFDNYNEEVPITCTIKQNSKLICVIFEMPKSTSYSISATVDDTQINGTILEYNYINIPKVDQNELLNIHLGSTTLKLNGNLLEGEYYNKQRDTSGKIYLKKGGKLNGRCTKKFFRFS